MRKGVFDGKSSPRLQGNFRANIGPALVMKEDRVVAGREIRD